MTKKISFFFYSILSLINQFIYFFFKKNFLLWFYSFIEKDAYETHKLNKKKIIFFSPNHLIKFRVNTIFEKEPETIKWIDGFNRDKKEIIFWDIGANIGLYSIYAASKFDNIKIISFEPSFCNLKILGRNISINKLSNKISIMSLPLNDKVNNKTFFLENFYDGSAYNSIINRDSNIKVHQNVYKTFSFSLDVLKNFFKLKFPNYIKIDIDGLENYILNGANSILKNKHLHSILVEIDKKNKKKVLELMKKNNFVLVSVNFNVKFSSEHDKSKNYIFIKK